MWKRGRHVSWCTNVERLGVPISLVQRYQLAWLSESFITSWHIFIKSFCRLLNFFVIKNLRLIWKMWFLKMRHVAHRMDLRFGVYETLWKLRQVRLLIFSGGGWVLRWYSVLWPQIMLRRFWWLWCHHLAFHIYISLNQWIFPTHPQLRFLKKIWEFILLPHNWRWMPRDLFDCLLLHPSLRPLSFICVESLEHNVRVVFISFGIRIDLLKDKLTSIDVLGRPYFGQRILGLLKQRHVLQD